MKKCVCMTFCIALIVLFTTPFAFGQALDGLWFQAKINVKGYLVDANGALDKLSGSEVNYLHITYNVSDTNYSITVFDDTGAIQSAGETFTTIGADENIVADLGLGFGSGANHVNTFQTSLITIKRDSKSGGIKSVTFNSMGCEVYSGQIEGNAFYGGCTMKAKKIDGPPFSS